jgi:hypothetical protein
MNEQFNASDIVERTDKDTNSPVVNSDPFADKVPVDAVPIHETPMGGGTDAAVGPVNRPLADEISIYETPVQEIHVGTVAVDGSKDETIVHHEASMSETIRHEAPIDTNARSSAALLNREESEHFRTRWNEIQGKFVDEPRAAVQQADTLVSEVIEQITQMFANEHSSLEGQWNQGNDVSTEDLRKALQRYRSFFNRLVV